MTIRALPVLVALLLLAGCGEPIDDHVRGPVARTGDHVRAYSPPLVASTGMERFVDLALDCVDREYPNKIGHVMASDADAGTPRSLHPAFFGCFDWHSSVHGHWLLAAAYFDPTFDVDRERIRDVLDRHLAPGPIAAEVDYLMADGRASWERPYGLAWLLQLAAELHAHAGDPDADRWAAALAPLEEACADRFLDWLPKLAYPIRTGEHSQTAFAFGLVWNWAEVTGRQDMWALIRNKSLEFYLTDLDASLAYEPSGQDFLSPILSEADLMTRVLSPARFAGWLEDFLPGIPHDGSADWLPLARVTDRADGKLAHLDGLNLSRAWNLLRIARALPDTDPRKRSVDAAARAHASSALAAVSDAHYAGGHWLGTYAVYLGKTEMETRAP